jgi:hypothetical protein
MIDIKNEMELIKKCYNNEIEYPAVRIRESPLVGTILMTAFKIK